MSVLEQYNKAVARKEINDDPAQRQIVEHFESLAVRLQRPWYTRLWGKPSIRGIYLYGPVGVGKTYLGNLLYEYVPIKEKARFHFHHFMQQVDAQLRALQGQKDPLRQLAKRLARSIRLIYFDEFMVSDVADAMILAELLQALFLEGIVFVATSNIAPDLLYAHGLHRERFIPAIKLIQQQCEVLSLGPHKDYRLGREPLSRTYIYPADSKATQLLKEEFSLWTSHIEAEGSLCVQKRMIPYVQHGNNAIWFSFDVICNLPRSSLDYLEIAERFSTVFVSDIPKLTASDTVRVILFIHFVDIMYDRGVRLVISAEVALLQLYQEGELLQKFQRTLSRLQEMQSADYIPRHQRHALSSFK